MTRLRILSTLFKITWHASKLHQEATVRSYLKKYPPSASVMSPKVQRNHRKTEKTSVTEARTLSKVLPENHSWNISAEFIRHILFTRGRLRRFWFWTFVFRKSRKTEAERVQLAKDEGILMFINLVISCDALIGAGTLHPQKWSFNFNPAKC